MCDLPSVHYASIYLFGVNNILERILSAKCVFFTKHEHYFLKEINFKGWLLFLYYWRNFSKGKKK